MNVQEILAQIDRAITEVDLVLHQWQEDLDMMSFIYVDASIELWTNDDPPRVVTPAVLAQAAGKELRVMNYLDGKPVQVGTAVVDENGMIQATLTEDIPQLRPRNEFYSVASSVAHFEMDKDGNVKQYLPKINPPFEGLNKPLTIRGLKEAIEKAEKPRLRSWGGLSFDELEDHLKKNPFFDKEN